MLHCKHRPILRSLGTVRERAFILLQLRCNDVVYTDTFKIHLRTCGVHALCTRYLYKVGRVGLLEIF